MVLAFGREKETRPSLPLSHQCDRRRDYPINQFKQEEEWFRIFHALESLHVRSYASGLTEAPHNGSSKASVFSRSRGAGFVYRMEE